VGVLFEMGLGADGPDHISHNSNPGIKNCKKTAAPVAQRSGDSGRYQRNHNGIFFGDKSCPGLWHGTSRDRKIQD